MENIAKRKLDFDTGEEEEENFIRRPKLTVRNGKNLQNSLPLLERSGRLINKLCIDYEVAGIEPLLDAIGKYCGENITEIEFARSHSQEERNTNEYKDGLNAFRSFLHGFENRFPNLSSLKISDNHKPEQSDIKHWDEVMKKFSLLKCLVIIGCPKFPLKNFFRLNGQLEQLTLINANETRIKRDLLETINELPNLSYLKIHFVGALAPMYAHAQPFGRKYFKNLKTLRVNFRSRSTEYSNVLRFLNPSVEKLEEFAFNVSGDLDDQSIKMLRNYKQLKRLELGADHITDTQLSLLAAQLPQIEMLTIFFRKKAALTGMGIVRFIYDCKQLTKIVINPGLIIYDKYIKDLCNPIKNQLEPGWSVGDDSYGNIEIIKKNEQN